MVSHRERINHQISAFGEIAYLVEKKLDPAFHQIQK